MLLVSISEMKSRMAKTSYSWRIQLFQFTVCIRLNFQWIQIVMETTLDSGELKIVDGRMNYPSVMFSKTLNG